MSNTDGVHTDNRGRIVDPHTGRPLRDHSNRTHNGQPFHGKSGKPNRKAAKRLAIRIAKWEETMKGRPKHDQHKPGSLK